LLISICFHYSGASTGIGRSTAELFAKRGAKVAITGRNAESLEVNIFSLPKGTEPCHMRKMFYKVPLNFKAQKFANRSALFQTCDLHKVSNCLLAYWKYLICSSFKLAPIRYGVKICKISKTKNSSKAHSIHCLSSFFHHYVMNTFF
jgi:hypothetical protein